MADLNAALIAFAGVLVGGYFNNFLAEDFRRFRDSQALAGALAGELESHAEAIPLLKSVLTALHGRAQSGAILSMREMPEPGSPVFEANVEKIGLLDPELAKGVAFVYENIRAFRMVMLLLSKHHMEEPVEWRTNLISSAYDRIKSAEDRGIPLVKRLKDHAAKSYWMRASTIKQCIVGLLAISVLGWATIRYASSPDHETKCATTLDNGTLTTVCK
ncbi:hypothetical protein [Paraburkholderia saeva]|uniref:hypothetical protein n=1 Tax=Paraburkholderia saeva TaxID=2777537 RepID=UPI001DD7A0C5|nr:hypothetical protein [Paraburkholderia saeva]CAG4914831.1 hypothetical protein R70241_04278 [Paraburkholderia saeva]